MKGYTPQNNHVESISEHENKWKSISIFQATTLRGPMKSKKKNATTLLVPKTV